MVTDSNRAAFQTSRMCQAQSPGSPNFPEAVGQVFNIGSLEEVAILELAQRVLLHTGSSSKVELLPYDQAYAPGFEDMRRRVPSVKKLQSLIGYEPRNGLDDSLLRVINWERLHPELEKPGG